jgi:hypothetical protein
MNVVVRCDLSPIEPLQKKMFGVPGWQSVRGAHDEGRSVGILNPSRVLHAGERHPSLKEVREEIILDVSAAGHHQPAGLAQVHELSGQRFRRVAEPFADGVLQFQVFVPPVEQKPDVP